MSSFYKQRRIFLKNMALGSLGTGVLALQGKLNLIQSAMASGSYNHLSDHKSLVCVFLYGGCDGHSMVVPYEQTLYNQYSSIRQSLSIAHSDLLPLSGEQYGFNNQLIKLHALYSSKKLAVAANVGNLYQPVTRAEILAETAVLPPDLFSHSHQEEIWQTGLSPETGVSHSGWGGRMADLLATANSNTEIPPTFALDGNNLWQIGNTTKPLTVRPWSGIPKFDYFSEDWSTHRIDSWQRILNLQSNHILARHLSSTTIQYKDRLDAIRAVYEQAPEITTVYDENSSLAHQLHAVARLISIRQELGMKRQIFFVGMGGWDTHGEQLNTHAALMTELDNSLDSFYKMTEELGVNNSVSTFTGSEFGRTLTTNGDGTDHAWGNIAFIMGGAVEGGKLYGSLPDYELAGQNDMGEDGRFIPQYSVDQYAATLAKWMGLDDSDLNEIFPHLNNFSDKDIGFINSGTGINGAMSAIRSYLLMN